MTSQTHPLLTPTIFLPTHNLDNNTQSKDFIWPELPPQSPPSPTTCNSNPAWKFQPIYSPGRVVGKL